jgi:hypothetical protein
MATTLRIFTIQDKGLHVSVYRTADLGDCTNGGLTARHNSVVVLGTNEVPINDGVFTMTDPAATLVLTRGPVGQMVAVPLALVTDGLPPNHVGPMFGGNFIYTSDSRFPARTPIPVFDRIETAEQYRALSM